MKKLLPNIAEGTDQYSLFRFFSTIMLFTIAVILLINVKETRHNRETGYHNRAVSCSVLYLVRQAAAKNNVNDPVITTTWNKSCQNPHVLEIMNAPR